MSSIRNVSWTRNSESLTETGDDPRTSDWGCDGGILVVSSIRNVSLIRNSESSTIIILPASAISLDI